MSDDGYRHDHLPTGGGTKFLGKRFREHGERPNGVTFMGRCARREQLHASFAAQMSRMRAEQEGVPRERTCRPCRESAVAGPTERDRGPAGARATAGSWSRAAHDGRGCRAIDGASGLSRSVNMSVPPGVTGVRAPSPTGYRAFPRRSEDCRGLESSSP